MKIAINASRIHCIHSTFNLIYKLIVMARKTDIVHYENNPYFGEPDVFTSLKQQTVFQAIIIHFDTGDSHDVKNKNKVSTKK